MGGLESQVQQVVQTCSTKQVWLIFMSNRNMQNMFKYMMHVLLAPSNASVCFLLDLFYADSLVATTAHGYYFFLHDKLCETAVQSSQLVGLRRFRCWEPLWCSLE